MKKDAKKSIIPVVHKYQSCIACGKRLMLESIKDDAFPDKIDHWGIVYGGVICRTRGNYGSTIYDPMDQDEYLQFYLCDRCVETKAKRIERNIVGKRREPLPEYFRRLDANKKVWEAYSRFKKKVAGDKQLSIWETKVLWLLQGLKSQLTVNHNVAVLPNETFNFVIPQLRSAIKIVGNVSDFLGNKNRDNFSESDRLKSTLDTIGWRVLVVRLNDICLRNDGLGKCWTALEEPLRNKIIDFVGSSNYYRLPEREPEDT